MVTPRITAHAVLVALATLLVLACGSKSDEAAPEGAGALAPPSLTAPEPPPPPRAPETEEELVRAFTTALQARDLPALKKLVVPELGADLERMHTTDADAFWGRGQQWIDNVASGFTIAAKQEGREERWRGLLRFENGNEETVVFARLDDKLLFAEL
ncbi:MAG: hypothetical protein KC635_14555 [Myxococcales bacterium]|nr:hypothetical protein [Myxococcales bacterium]MCB9733518.1 hypothetical protein [Deltaproteobacteria bacterium]